MATTENNDVYTLESSDNTLIKASKRAVQLCTVLSELLDSKFFLLVLKQRICHACVSDTTQDQNDTIPVPLVDANTLRKVMQWCEHHKNDDDKTKYTSGAFYDVEPRMLFSILNVRPSLQLVS